MLDLQNLVDSFHTMTCVLSVEKKADGKKGLIRIEAANKYYIQSMTNTGSNKDSIFKQEFVPGSEYQRYMPKELNFENFCYQSAILKKPIHAYIRPEHYNFWINQFLLPIEVEDSDKAYCTYSIEISKEADVNTMTAVSADVSANVLKTCIKLRGANASDLPKAMDDVVHDIRDMCDALCCCVLLTDFKQRTCSVFADSVKDGVNLKSMRESVTDDFIDVASSWIDTLKGSTCLVLKDENDFDVLHERNPMWYETLKMTHIDSVVLLPLQNNNETVGFIFITNFDTSRVLRIKETLDLASFIISSEIASYLMVKKLEVMSNVDLLTGAYNRNSMNNRIMPWISGQEPTPQKYGIVFADLNGLKPVNDRRGHDAGDQLLKDATAILKDVFYDCEIYRAGGDEFMLIALDVEEAELEKRVEKIRNDSLQPHHVSFAIGLCYTDCGRNVRDVMRDADGTMYMDKRRFYNKFPELKMR